MRDNVNVNESDRNTHQTKNKIKTKLSQKKQQRNPRTIQPNIKDGKEQYILIYPPRCNVI